MLQGISKLAGQQERRPGGHNWPDLEIVIDPAQTNIEDGEVYLVQITDRDPVVKKCTNVSPAVVRLDPAIASIHDQTTVNLFGRNVPCQGIEFSDDIYRRYIAVLGKVVGLWAGART